MSATYVEQFGDAILAAIERSKHLSDWQMGYMEAHEGFAFAPEAFVPGVTRRRIQFANGFLTRRPDCEEARIYISKRQPAPSQPDEEPPWLEQFDDDEPTDAAMWYYYEDGREIMSLEEAQAEYDEQRNQQRNPWQY